MNNDIILPENTEQMKDFLKESYVDFNSDDSFTASCKMAMVINRYKSKVRTLTSAINTTYPDDTSSAYAEYYKDYDKKKVQRYAALVYFITFLLSCLCAFNGILSVSMQNAIATFFPFLAAIIAFIQKKKSLKKKWMDTKGKEMLERNKEHLEKVPRYTSERNNLNRRLIEVSCYLSDFVELNFNAVPEQYWDDVEALFEIYTSRRASDVSQAINILEQDKAMKQLNNRIKAAESSAASAQRAANYAQQSADEALEALGYYPNNY